jgi:RHS repeat-associated protein
MTGTGATHKLYYIEPDALGTPRVVIDPSRGAQGTAVWNWELTGKAFGNTEPNQDPDGDATIFVLNMRFPGQRYDAASDLSYNYFRDYDPSTGRYVESDPIGLRGAISTYGYAHNNPKIWIDARGLSPITCANIQSRAGAGTVGTIQCDGSGGYEIVSCGNSCTNKCTIRHERQHVYDWFSRYGRRGCSNRAKGDLPDDESSAPLDITPYERFRAMSECRAYKAGIECAQGIINANCGCMQEARDYKDSAEQQRVAYSCNAYGL